MEISELELELEAVLSDLSQQTPLCNSESLRRDYMLKQKNKISGGMARR